VDERDLDDDPIRQFGAWYRAAVDAGVAQPDAVALATATADGRPSVRMVLLKSFDESGFVFYTNRESRKGAELRANPHAALAVYWQPLRRQVRVDGMVMLASDAESVAYFATRPRSSQLAAWASPQTRAVPDRRALDGLYEDAAARFEGEDVPLPPFWGGYRIAPAAVEFWEGRDDRLHDRFRYERTSAGWARVRLAP
jgi:pyridoxamine 5'-phosphate oxidase